MKQIRWAILGTSYISEVMANAIQASTISQLVAIGSRSFTRGKMLSDKFSIPKIYDDYLKLLDDADIDAVYIGLPNHLHKEWIIRCAEAGKHILCEKPFVVNPVQAREVISVIEKSNVFCMEALMYRCHPFIKKLQEIIQSKMIGDVKLYQAVYTANITGKANPTAGGSIRNLGCYPISLIRLLESAEPIEIISLGRIDKKNNIDHQASAILKFSNDCVGTVSTADDIEMFWQFDVYGTAGSLKVISNPWLPDYDTNKMVVNRYDDKVSLEMKVTAEKPLYTYQIDTVSHNIINKNYTNHDGISWQDSLGNITVLDNWFKQVVKR